MAPTQDADSEPRHYPRAHIAAFHPHTDRRVGIDLTYGFDKTIWYLESSQIGRRVINMDHWACARYLSYARYGFFLVTEPSKQNLGVSRANIEACD